MGQKEKLIAKLKTTPKNFTFDDAETLLEYFTFNKIEQRENKWITCKVKSMGRSCCTNRIHKKN